MRFDRRNFLQLSAGFCLASALPTAGSFASASASAADADAEKSLKIVPLELNVGAEKPFSAMHVSDSHFCFADDRDNERKLKLAKDRSKYFRDGERFFDAALAYAQKKDALFLHTGDLIDFVSAKNLDVVRAKFEKTNSFVSSGNHEFSQYVGEAKEDDAYKARSFERVQKAYPNDLTFASRTINGVNFVAFDDVYYNVSPAIFERFKEEVAKGLPIVALCHCPLYAPDLFDVAMAKPNARCAYIVGVPDERAKDFEPGRFQQQRGDETTFAFIEWLKEQPLLKAILCGHLHYFHDGAFSKTANQYVVGGNFEGAVREIAFV